MAYGWTVEVRDSSKVRLGQLSIYDLSQFFVVPRTNNLGSWSIRLPNSLLNDAGVRVPHELCAALRTQGAGVIVTGPHGVVLTGPMTLASQASTSDEPDGIWNIQGVSDLERIAKSLAYPQPSNSDPSSQTVSNDVRAGTGEALMRAYISSNIGPAASAERQTGLTLAADGGRGVTLSKSPRFQNLLELTQEIAVGSGLLFDVVQVGPDLQFQVSVPEDVSRAVRWDIANNQLSQSKFGYSAPGCTRVFVAGQGEGAERTIVEVTTPASLLSEAIWGRSERFVDQRNTDDLDELLQAGLEVLAAEGSVVTSLEVVPSEDMAEGFGTEWNLGSWVTIVVNDQEIVAQIAEVPISFPDGVFVGAVVGDPTGFDWESVLAAKQTKTESRVSALEQNAEATAGIPVGAIQEFAGSTAPNGFLLCDGSLVSRTTYATLFAVLGVVFGSGDGSTTFAVPNHAGRVAAGKGSGTFATLGATGGAETVALSAAQTPSHTHTYSGTTSGVGNHTHAGSVPYKISGGPAQVNGEGIVGGPASLNYGYYNAMGTFYTTPAGGHNHTFSGTTSAVGSNQAHENLAPFIVMNFIIKT
jgi:microcystin-dependent protein